MPRIAKSEHEKQMDAVARRIRHHYDDIRRDRDIDCFAAAKTMGICYATLRNRLMSPATFTLGELHSIANAMNISVETLIRSKEDAV